MLVFATHPLDFALIQPSLMDTPAQTTTLVLSVTNAKLVSAFLPPPCFAQLQTSVTMSVFATLSLDIALTQ